MKKIILSASLILAALTAQAQTCEAVATLSEDFSDFTAGTSWTAENCWSGIAAGYPSGVVYVDGTDNKYAVYYGAGGTGALSYLVGPEISTFDGAHQLSFTTWKLAQGGTVPAGTVTIQVGTITDVANAATFTAFGDAIAFSSSEVVTFDEIVIPSAPAGSHIAWRFSTTNMHNAVAIDDVTWEAVPAPACTAVATIDEDFTDFVTGVALPFNCWSSIANGPMVYTGSAGGSITFYASTSANVAAYLVSPEVSTFDGNHQLTFDARKSTGGVVTLQTGYLTNPTDATTFVTVGDAITLTSDVATYTVEYPELIGNAYVAFQYIGGSIHQAAITDNVVWNEIPAVPCEAVATIDEDFTDFVTGVALPFNCWSSIANGPMVYTGATGGSITFYASTSAGVAAYLVSPEVSTFDGNHQLTFDARKSTGGVVTLQTGYLTNPTDATTFVTVGDAITLTSDVATYTVEYPELTGNAYVAFQYIGASIHQAAITDNVVWDEIPVVECAAVETFTEDFADFTTTTAFPSSCWNTIAGTPPNGPMIYVAAAGGVTYYAGSNNTTPAYLITPEVSTIDGAHKLDFTATLSGPSTTVTLQLGYITNVADATTFVAVGDVIAITAANSTFSNIVFPAITGNAHLAFRFTSVAPHQAVVVDNVSWLPVAAGTNGFIKNGFTLYPNPANGNVNIATNGNSGVVSIYSTTGNKVFETTVNSNSQNINVSALSAGLYIVRYTSGTATATQKLIVR
jgi:Secretion system C-terminal sorting domain